jgi:anti-anti-sigma factor
MPAPVRSARGETARDRLEDWIVHALDDAPGEPRPSARPTLRLRPDASPAEAAPSAWATVHVRREGGVCVAHVAVNAILKPQALREVARELFALAGSCSGRLVLDLAAVERLASAFVATLVRLHRRCTARDGGALRICGLRPELQPLLNLTGLDVVLHHFPDVAAALAAPWPRPHQAGVLPVDVLRELAAPTSIPSSSPPPPPIALRIETGPRRGRLRTVPPAGATIGRSGDCDFRCACPSVSRHHARLEPTADGWIVADLDSRNGTRLNGRRLREPALVRPGDLLHFGDLQIKVLDALDADGRGSLDDQVAAWLIGPDVDRLVEPEGPTVTTDSAPDLPDGVRLLAPRVDDSDDPENWRARLDDASGGDPNARLVIDLQHVASLPSRALGILLARAVELQRQGGGLRLAHPNPELRARLEWLRVPELIPVFPRLEDAILTSWE